MTHLWHRAKPNLTGSFVPIADVAYFMMITNGILAGMKVQAECHHSFQSMTNIPDNNAYIDESDERLLLAFKYQF